MTSSCPGLPDYKVLNLCNREANYGFRFGSNSIFSGSYVQMIKTHNRPLARSLRSLKTQRTQRKKIRLVLIGLSLRALRLCVRPLLILSSSCQGLPVSKIYGRVIY